MRLFLKRTALFLFAVCILSSLLMPVYAQNNTVQAKEITSASLVVDQSGFPALKYLFNNKYWETQKTEDTAHLTLEYKDGIGSLNLSFMHAYGPYTIINNDTGKTYTAGTDLFIHEFIDLTSCFGSAPTSVTISFENGPAELHELDVYTEGAVPDSVQKWEQPEEGKIDLILFATHSDDDQLFFAGLLPYYAVERDYQVLVIYLTDHYNTAPGRAHEVLTGLWSVGVTNYPVLGHFEDFGDANSAKEAFQKFAKYGHSQEDMTNFVVEQLRRFKPMVAVGHDLNGEYGHAQHKAYAQMLTDAVAISGDASYHPESAEKYGTWDVPKTYVHLYKENQIVMDWDQPMEKFNGMTPFEVSKELGFPAHVSQQKGWAWYYEGKHAATELKKYSPCLYGLFRSTVGEDLEKKDMFENLTSHAELDRIEEEKRMEAERLEAEQLEAERLETEQQTEAPQKQEDVIQPATAEPVFPETEETNPSVSEPAGSAAPESRKLILWLGVEGLLIVILVMILLLRRKRRHNY